VGAVGYAPWSLPVTVKDINAIRAVLIDPNLCGYPSALSHIRLLQDQAATRTAILDGLAWLKAACAADAEATAVVYYSGHGWLDQGSGRFFLIPHDVAPFDIAGSALSADDFAKALRGVAARRLLAVIDSCHAEGMGTSKETANSMKLPPGLAPLAPPKSLVDDLKQGEGRAVFTSSRGQQVSWVRPDRSLSVYTHHLLEALQGAGNRPGDKAVRLSNLMNHLGHAVPASVRAAYNAQQTPFFDTATEDFPIAELRGGKGLPAAGWEAVKAEAEQAIRQVVTVTASGERAVAVGGAVSGAIITGDQTRRRP
jgi:uncharacterized caspase-like protein